MFGFAPDAIKPTVLVLNLLVSAIISWKFYKEGHLNWRAFWPFVIFSIPTAFAGGAITLPPSLFNRLLGGILFIAAIPLFRRRNSTANSAVVPPWPISAFTGSAIGFLSGLTGVGGGILLSPTMIYFNWADSKSTSAISGVFILANSAAALLGHLQTKLDLPAGLPFFASTAGVGALLGTQFGTRRLSPQKFNFILGVLLLAAAVKFLS